jgi:DegV family protein with EDD domain
MTLKIVTDSISDLSVEIVTQLGITVVPMIVIFGENVYRDGIDLSTEQFYEKLQTSKVFPHTTIPSPGVFAQTYDKLAQETDEILVITVSSKLTGAYVTAKQGIALMKKRCRVEVLDTSWATMAEGFVVMAAAKATQAGASFEEVKNVAKRTSEHVEFHATFNTLEYLRRGGRIGRARAYLGSMLRVNPVITLKDGVVEPVGRARSRAKAIDMLYEFAQGCAHIEEMAVEDTACPDEADNLVGRLAALYPKERIYRSKMTPTVGAHTGPGLLLVAIQGELHSRI